MKKKQIKITETKKTVIGGQKYSMNKVNKRLEPAKERISEMDGRAGAISQNEAKKS